MPSHRSVLFACFEVFFVGFATLVALSLVEALGWWPIVAGNILAATAMVGFFLKPAPGAARTDGRAMGESELAASAAG